MDYVDIVSEVRTITDAQLAGFQPILPSESRRHHNLLNLLMNGTKYITEDARIMKQGVLSTNEELSSYIASAKKQTRDALSRGEGLVLLDDIPDIDRAMQLVGSKYPWFGLSYERLQINPILHRWAKLSMCLHLGYGNCWQEKALNVKVASKRDDFTDMSLSLYASDGDVILSKDAKFRNAFRFIDPHRKVEIKTWDELIKTLY